MLPKATGLSFVALPVLLFELAGLFVHTERYYGCIGYWKNEPLFDLLVKCNVGLHAFSVQACRPTLTGIRNGKDGAIFGKWREHLAPQPVQDWAR